ncbi:MAG: ABC transporter ATP-binding protein [Firmicutes bacterium]|nr:ABC transporter ATP-binding protein [Bacillota bacterium]
MSILRCENLVMRFGGVTAVDDFSPHVDPGEIVAVIGPNGAGKTTAFNMITGVYKPASGRVFLEQDGQVTMRDITGMRPDRVAALGIARTFQNIRLFKSQTVLENVLIACHVRVRSGLFGAEISWPRYYLEERAMRERAMALLERVGLQDAAGEMATSLPYGKQRRLEIARALATQPKLLLLDEPAAGMNPKETEDLTRFVYDLRGQMNLAVLMIEHHMQIVMDISDRIYVLDYGRTIAQGTAAAVQANPAVIEAYLGVEEA